MKVLFLDVDGVITHQHYKNEEREGLDPEKIKLVARIVKDTGAFVVLSSSWRLSYDQKTEKKDWDYVLLEKCLGDEGVSIYDITTRIPFSDTMPWRRTRPLEILDWVIEHKVNSFAILDDDEWDFARYGLDKHWVHTSAEDGISIKDVILAEDKIDNIKFREDWD